VKSALEHQVGREWIQPEPRAIGVWFEVKVCERIAPLHGGPEALGHSYPVPPVCKIFHEIQRRLGAYSSHNGVLNQYRTTGDTARFVEQVDGPLGVMKHVDQKDAIE
jgi:hypothetical protein